MLTAPPRSRRLAVYLADVAALLCVAALLLHFQNGGRPTPSGQWTGEIRQVSALVTANFATYVRTDLGTPGQGGRNDYRPPAAVATIKDTIHAAIPVVREASEYAAVRALLRQMGGAPALLGELEALGFVSEGRLTTGTKPLNVFARVAAGVVTQPGMEAEQANLGAHGQRFMIACNLPENEEHWSSTAPEWVGRASMGQRHRFMLVRKLHYTDPLSGHIIRLIIRLISPSQPGNRLSRSLDSCLSPSNISSHTPLAPLSYTPLAQLDLNHTHLSKAALQTHAKPHN